MAKANASDKVLASTTAPNMHQNQRPPSKGFRENGQAHAPLSPKVIKAVVVAF